MAFTLSLEKNALRVRCIDLETFDDLNELEPIILCQNSKLASNSREELSTVRIFKDSTVP